MPKPEEKNYADLVLDLKDILPTQSVERMMRLLVELEMMIEDYDRYITIEYLAGNYSSKKHLTVIILRGLGDSEIIESMVRMKDMIRAEINSRKKK